ncbi:MAG TPA: alpha/beta hydrolase [Phenylobacterium sp.]|nr:alpha/beta hydrolase [Phenylobacterium sp.]
MRRSLAALVLALGLCANAASAAETARCQPAGVGQDSFCRVNGIRLHYVDWGGRGPAVVLLSGLGDAGRIFDDLAPRLTATHRVIAVTRRGYGQSDHPAQGYANADLVGDVLGLMDALGVAKASFVGHSIAGGELSTLGADHPDRVERLVYLDAAYDRSRALELTNGVPPGAEPTKGDLANLAAQTRWRQALLQTRSPAVAADLGQIMAQHGDHVAPTSGLATLLAVLQGDVAAPPRYAAIQAPALAFYTSKDVADQIGPGTAPLQREAIIAYSTRKIRPWMLRAQADFLEQKTCGVAVELPHSTHYFFLRAPARTAALITSYLVATNPCAWRPSSPVSDADW